MPIRGTCKGIVKDTFESWLVGELLLVALLGSATALFLTNPILRNTYELPEGRLVLDTAVVLAATIVAILAGVRFSVEGRALDLLLAAGFFVAGVGTLAFSVAPVLGGSNQGAPEAWAAIGSRVLAATLIALAPLVPAPRIVARAQVLFAGIALLVAALCRDLAASARLRRQAQPARRRRRLAHVRADGRDVVPGAAGARRP